MVNNIVVPTANGKEIQSLIKANQIPGNKTIKWDGLNNKGNKVPSGIYICKIQMGDLMQMEKILILK